MLEIYSTVNIGPGVLVDFQGSPNNSVRAKEVVLRSVDLANGSQTMLQRQNIPQGGQGYFLQMPAEAGKPLYLLVAFIDANGKDLEGSSVVSVIPG